MDEIYISVDVETAGPYPGEYAMLAIGACLVDDTSSTFYAELQPDRPGSTEEALEISGLSLDELKLHGKPPKDVMEAFAEWLKEVAPEGKRAIMVAFNAPFDWMFVHDYFHRYLGYNPFGHSAIDIKAYYMGYAKVPWAETSMKWVTAAISDEKQLAHNALHDAQDQAEIFRELLSRNLITQRR